MRLSVVDTGKIWWSFLEILNNSNTNLEASWTPVHKLNGPLGLDCCNGSIYIFWYHITTVQQTTGHVFPMTWVTFNHLISWLKTGIGDFSNTQLLVISFLCWDHWGIGGQRKVDTGVWYQVGLQTQEQTGYLLEKIPQLASEVCWFTKFKKYSSSDKYLKLCQINIQGTIKAQWSSDWWHNLTNQSVQVGVSGSLNIQVAATDVIDGFIVNHEGTVRVLQSGVSCQDRVVGLYNSCSNLWCRVDCKFQLGFLAIVNWQTLHEQRSKSRASTTTKGMENKETLQTSTLISLRRNSKQRFKLPIWEITLESISSVKKANVTSILRELTSFLILSRTRSIISFPTV